MSPAPNAAQPNPAMPSDYVEGARGHTVLALGGNERNAESVAVWQLSPAGLPVGAWILPLEEVGQNSNLFEQVMALQGGRCLIGWDYHGPAAVIDHIRAHLPRRTADALRRNVLVIPDLLAEVAEERTAIAKAADLHRRTVNPKVRPLTWRLSMPTARELQAAAAAAHKTAPSSVAADALQLSTAVARVAQLWQDTEETRYRRNYLRSIGELRPLPPRWQANLRAAATDVASKSTAEASNQA